MFRRAGFRCQGPGCGFRSTPERAAQELDAHHITDRNVMPNGGYVPENGIALCAPCHELAERFHATGSAHPGYSPADLYIDELQARLRAKTAEHLDADRTSSHTLRANQLRLWLSSLAYLILHDLRRLALAGTGLACWRPMRRRRTRLSFESGAL